MSGPVLDAPDVEELVRFYERFLGWEVEELYGARPGNPPGDGCGRVRPPDKAPGQKIEVQWERHYQRPVWPGARPGRPPLLPVDVTGSRRVASTVLSSFWVYLPVPQTGK